MSGNPVGWFEIYVNDMPRAKQFYETVFGMQLQRLNSNDIEMWSFPMADGEYGASGALVKMDGFAAGGNSTLVYFSSADCALEAERASAAGGHILKPKMPIGEYGYIALVIDTEGNMIGVHSMQ
jgi:predicted enzyme related to lactoylglutathione lyase